MTSSRKQRLKNVEIVILRSLFKRGAHYSPISLKKWKWRFTIDLCRRGILRIFYEQVIGDTMRGPFFMLTVHGAYLASMLFPAPRGLSGAQEDNQ